MAETDGRERSAVLLIRVWRETGHPASFRARLTGDPGPFSVVATDPEQVVAAVRVWLATAAGSS